MAKDDQKKSNKGMFIIIIVILLLVIVVGGIAAFFIISKTLGKGVEGEKKIVEEVLSLDEFIVNINDPSLNKYVKFKLAVTYDSKDKDILEDINSNIHRIKDGIISIFKEKRASDINDNNGIEQIKQEIRQKINFVLEDNEVISVYFTDLLIH